MKTVQPWKEDSKRKNVTAKEKLEGIIQIAATNQNFSVAEEQQIEDEIAGVPTQRFQELKSRHFHFKQKNETHSRIYKYPFSLENQQFSAD